MDEVITNELIAACRREYAPRIKAAFEANRARGNAFIVIPFVGGVYLAHDPRAERAAVKKVSRALCAQKWFELTAPPDFGPLQIRPPKYEELIQNGNNKQKFVGFFARSLDQQDFKYQIHPTFPIFVAGALAVVAPAVSLEALYADVELRYRFPPRELVGFCPADMCWRVPGTDLMRPAVKRRRGSGLRYSRFRYTDPIVKSE
jgi:hypothetical protein